MKIFQKEFTLPKFSRGVHLITKQIHKEVPEITKFKLGVLHIQLMHTSASLSINENADPTVRADLEKLINHIVPDDLKGYTHVTEGKDDMPAHAKASLLGSNLSIPLKDGCMNLGTWQGIYLCEHRDHALKRNLVITIMGALA